LASSTGSSFFMPMPMGCSTIGSLIIFSATPSVFDWLTSLVMVMVLATMPTDLFCCTAMKAEPVSWKVTGSEPFILIDISEVEPLVELRRLPLKSALAMPGSEAFTASISLAT
jgi:hypothetical protein